jgi:hypothetical protein
MCSSQLGKCGLVLRDVAIPHRNLGEDKDFGVELTKV